MRISHSKRPTGERVIIEDESQWQTGYVSVPADEVQQLIKELREVCREAQHDPVAELRKELNA